ncbi:MAG: hypothetical protein MUO63_15870 [Desulfobulbaceae bacterium]|nr:hypothetical protein [Desulfobulbaceae bacterium]
MFTTFFSFLIVGVIFCLFSLLGMAIWPYLVPSALIFSHLWLRAYNYRFKSLALLILQENPKLFEEEIEKEIFLSSPSVFLAPFNYITTFARLDFTSATVYSMFISIIYGIYSVFKSEWLVVIACVWIVYDSAIGNISAAFEAAEHEQNILHVGSRYLKSKNKSIMKISKDEVLHEFAEHYENIVDRLTSLALKKRDVDKQKQKKQTSSK